MLAILLLHRGEVVSVDRVVDELWGERPPDTATKTVQVYVSRLRKALGEGVLVTRGGGYALEVGADQVDAGRFERLAREGAKRSSGATRRRAAERLSAALDLWRGPPLADFAYESFAQNETARLEECAWPCSRTASKPTWHSAGTLRWSPSSRPWWGNIQRASVCGVSSCSRCIARAGSPMRSRATATHNAH